MAELSELFKDIKGIPTTNPSPSPKKFIGKKRRHYDDAVQEINGHIQPLHETDTSKRYMQPVHITDTSKRYINKSHLTDTCNGYMQPLHTTDTYNGCIDTLFESVTYIPFKKLRDNPLKTIIFLHIKSDANNNFLTEKLSLRDIRENTGMCYATAKASIRRLRDWGFICIVSSQRGASGWTQYKINKNVIDELKKASTNGYMQTLQISSSSNIIKTTTTEEPTRDNLSQHEIDIEPLEHIGFAESHVKQILSSGVNREQLQESIYHFAFDYEHNKLTIRKTALDMFVGAMLKFKYYNAPTNYESPAERAERLRIENKIARELKMKELYKKELELDYQNWKASISREEWESYVSPGAKKMPEQAKDADVKKYYEVNLWRK